MQEKDKSKIKNEVVLIDEEMSTSLSIIKSTLKDIEKVCQGVRGSVRLVVEDDISIIDQ